MQLYYYTVLFGLSFGLTLLYVLRWRRQFDVHMSLLFLLIPVVNLAYVLMYTSGEKETIVALLKLVYIGGCFLPWLITMCELKLCQIEPGRALRAGSLLLSSCVYLAVLSIGWSGIFYRSFEVERVGTVLLLRKVYGPFHTLHYACILLYLLADLAVLVYSYRRQRQVSRRVLLLLFIPIPVAALGYFASRPLLRGGIELVPLTYVLAQGVYLLITRRMAYYSVSEMVIESMAQSGETGFITVDAAGRYLGSNETAKLILPALRALTVDQPVRGCEALRGNVDAWLDRFEAEPGAGKLLYAPEGSEKLYTVTVGYLLDGNKRCGYQIFLEDDTQNQKYIRLLDRYNADLQAEVAVKTERLVAMHDRLVLGMATMVESRDNSTGGHIRRTSEGVRLLTEAMRADSLCGLTEDFCKKLIEAAPMHDLGKIAVDDAILRKPGRFTPEEFEKMKSHAAEGARIVHEILQDTDDDAFRRIAENVAHYHHERWDGSGYPDGLRGEQIPLEARIMAVADVYDALVSKRVYKERFSFAEADRIIREGMGTQFDARLLPYYQSAREKLEAFYAGEIEGL